MTLDRRAASAQAGAGAAYVVLCLLIVLNSALHDKGLPSLSTNNASGQSPLGSTALTVTATLALALLITAIARGGPNRIQWVLIVLVALWLGSPWLSLGLLEGVWDGDLLALGATGTGVALAAALAGPTLIRWVLYVSGAIWAGTSLVAGIIATTTRSALVPGVLVADEADRFTRWVQVLGFDVPDGSVLALEGLSLHRNIFGVSLALLLVVQLRHTLTVQGPASVRVLLMALGPGLTGTALLWTLSRTSILAGAVGLLAGLIPIERIRRFGALVAVGLASVLIAISPLLIRDHLVASLEPGTLRWRALLWQELMAEPGVWEPTGLGPRAPLPLGAYHAHNQALETLVNGGWLAAFSLLSLAILGVVVAARVAGLDRRAAFSCVITAAVVCQTEIIATSKGLLEAHPASVIVIAVVVSAAQLLDSGKAHLPPGRKEALTSASTLVNR